MADLQPIVYVVDDDESMLNTVRCLAESLGLEAKTYSAPRTFLHEFDGSRPACLVLDVQMPEMSGLELQELLVTRGVRMPTIIFTAHGEVPGAVRAMRTGALDYLEKPFSNQTLLARLRQAAQHAVQMHQQAIVQNEVSARLQGLSKRENQVMRGLADGLANKQIAAQLGLSEKTVEVYRSRLMKKLGVHTIAELVRIVLSAPRTTQ
jgi:RNA polymerase sigma factor (sigma-70 family)